VRDGCGDLLYNRLGYDPYLALLREDEPAPRSHAKLENTQTARVAREDSAKEAS
jgi:hypothetical protein